MPVWLFELGGWVMWPLLVVSIAVVAIIVERGLFLSSFPFPDKAFPALILEMTKTGDPSALAGNMGAIGPLSDFSRIFGDMQYPNKEAALRVAGESVVSRLEAGLSMLSLLTRVAPLLGLLGTVFGMITTFSRISETRSGVDMNMLAGGIWQALLTTVTGLCIAIPALLFLNYYQNRARRAAKALAEAGNTVLLLRCGNM
jgi:biopolymer transport protein ExbB